MEQSRKDVLKQTGLIAIGQAVGTVIMIGVYLILQKFEMNVLWGALVGNVLAIGNFFFMAIIATLSADRAKNQDVEGGQKLMKASYPIRLLVLAGILALCAWGGKKNDWFDLVALVLPLAFTHLTAMLVSFFKKKGA
jgi:hypothetical protein